MQAKPEPSADPDSYALAERVRDLCIQAAIDGYERAAIAGLCREGAWEAAISAIRTLDLQSELNPPADEK